MYELNSLTTFINRFPWQPQFAWDVIKAAQQVGLGSTEDLMGEKITGFTVAQTISKDGVRLSTPRAFLWPHRNRKNLHIALNATVTKVNTRKTGSVVRAIGINLVMVSLYMAIFFFNFDIHDYVSIKLYVSTRHNFFFIFRMASHIR